MTKEEKLIDMCVMIESHCNLDREITLCGNGTNCMEAANVSRKILGILEIDRKDLEERIQASTKEWAEVYNIEGYDEE